MTVSVTTLLRGELELAMNFHLIISFLSLNSLSAVFMVCVKML